MTPTLPMLEVATLDRVEIAFEPWSWPFAIERRDDIERHFVKLQAARTGVWNGRVLLMRCFRLDNRVLRGACFETDYASLCAWRDWSHPDPAVCNFFAAAALRSADGAYLVGEMAAYTAAAGLLYFPCGTPEPADLDRHGRFDLDGNLRRELLEETGLDMAELDREPGWLFVRDRGYFGLLKQVTARQAGAALRARIMQHLRKDAQPEFRDIRIIRGPGDVVPRMPPFVVTFLQAAWRQRSDAAGARLITLPP